MVQGCAVRCSIGNDGIDTVTVCMGQCGRKNTHVDGAKRGRDDELHSQWPGSASGSFEPKMISEGTCPRHRRHGQKSWRGVESGTLILPPPLLLNLINEAASMTGKEAGREG